MKKSKILKNNKKIAIIGNAGSGKTTLALKLKEILQLPIIHLDQYYWKPHWEKRDFAEFYSIHNELCEQDEWIMEGNYVRAFYPRIFHADVVIYIDVSRYHCVARIIKRMIFNYGKTGVSLPPNCPEQFNGAFWIFLKWVWNFDKRYRYMIVDLLDEFKNEKQIYILKSQKEVDNFLNKIFNKSE